MSTLNWVLAGYLLAPALLASIVGALYVFASLFFFLLGSGISSFGRAADTIGIYGRPTVKVIAVAGFAIIAWPLFLAILARVLYMTRYIRVTNHGG